jgi:hydroxymethylbilane synthase
MKITIGSRGSKLALWQAGWVRDQLLAHGHEVEIKVIKTTGDKLGSVLLTESGTKGLFIREIEEALAEKAIDLAVHSLKDLPTEQPQGLWVAAVPSRADARDVLISTGLRPLHALPAKARVGTGSLRRQAQLRALRGDLEVLAVRGNVDTRLRKLDQGYYDALVLAAAGLERLGLSERVAQYFAVEQMCPAVGQGALAIEAREGDERIERAVRPLDDPSSRCAVRAERAMLRRLGGGCQAPIAAHAWSVGGNLCLLGVVAALDGSKIIRTTVTAPADDHDAVGSMVAQDLLKQGAGEILGSSPGEVPSLG